MNPAVKWIGGAFLGFLGLLFAFFLMIGVMIQTGVLPSDRVVTGEDLSKKHMTVLIEAGLLDADETLELFFSEGLFSIKEGGSLLTDRRVVVFGRFENNDEVEAYEMRHEDIVAIKQTQQGDFSSYAVYQVHSHDEDAWIELWLPHEYDDDKRFVDAIKEKIPHKLRELPFLNLPDT